MTTTTLKRALFRACPTLPLVVFLLSSCSTGRLMHREFYSVNTAYGDALNDQMLLNIARLDNGHPAYYLAVGTIHNKLTFQSDTTAGGSHIADPDKNAGNSVWGDVGLGLNRVFYGLFGASFKEEITGTTTPEFQFIPLNNEELAQQVLKPIPTDVFTALYLQDFPIDQLMRVLIERVETTLPDGEELVLINSPTRGTPENYGRFLRACAILRELQRNGNLQLEAHMQFEKNSGATNETHAASSGSADSDKKAKGSSDQSAHANNSNPSDSFVIPTFYLRPEQTTNVMAQLRTSKELFDAEAVKNMVELLTNGITIKTDVSNRGQGTTRLVLRSFDRATEATASEQDAFAALLKESSFTKITPASEQRPILKTIWTDKHQRLEPPVTKIDYAGKTYQVTDPVTENLLDPGARWNRNSFRLLVALGSQVTVDISKYERQIIELQQ